MRLAVAESVAIDAALLLKNPAFKDEQEVRIIVGADDLKPFYKFRPTQYGLSRYVEIGAHDDHGLNITQGTPSYLSCSAQSGLPIECIWIGPQNNSNSAENELQGLLENYGYYGIKIYRSMIPVR